MTIPQLRGSRTIFNVTNRITQRIFNTNW